MKKLSLLAVLFLLLSCTSKTHHLTSIEATRISMTSAYDKRPSAKAVAVLNQYKHTVDSISSPILGYSNGCYTAYRPESPLSNLAADILYQAGQKRVEQHVDFAITNIGGIRNNLLDGPITYGRINSIFPFINTLVVLEMDGTSVEKLIKQIIAVNGEAISHMRIVVNKNKELISATIGGKKIQTQKKYIVSTINYLAEGNDGLSALKEGKVLLNEKDLTVKEIVIDYIKALNKQKQSITAQVEGRITVK